MSGRMLTRVAAGVFGLGVLGSMSGGRARRKHAQSDKEKSSISTGTLLLVGGAVLTTGVVLFAVSR